MTTRKKLLAMCLALAVGGLPIAVAAQQACVVSSNVTVLKGGLDNPRGLKFGPDGFLYVAEGGTGGTQDSQQECPALQVLPPVGPYTGDFNSGIAKISPAQVLTPVVSGLPSSQTAAAAGSFVSGVADIAFIGDQLYGVMAGAGCSHGLAGTQNSLFRVSGGTVQPIADLGAYAIANPTANENPGDFEPEGTWFSMIAVRGDLYAVEPNHGEIVRVSPDGAIHRVVDISAKYGHVVPTAIAYDGNFYVGTLGTFENGFLGMVIKVTPSGQSSVVLDELTSITGLVVDRGAIYILENQGGFVAGPCAGRVLRVPRSGNLAQSEEIATGLSFPTAMTLGPDGNLYVSNISYTFGVMPGQGEIVRIDLH